MKSSKETARSAFCRNKPKKVKGPTFLQKIFNQRYVDRSLYYFTSGSGYSKDNYRDISKEKDQYSLPLPSVELSNQQLHRYWRGKERKEELSLKYYERHTQATSLTKDLLRRLYIPPKEKKPLSSTPDILDIDDDFYTIIDSTPQKSKFSKRQYVEDAREILKMHLQMIFYGDEVLLIKEIFDREELEIAKVKSKLKTFHRAFDAILRRDHERASKVYAAAESQSEEIELMMEELKEEEKKLEIVRIQADNLEDSWMTCVTLQKAMYSMSPVYWRKKRILPKVAPSDVSESEEELSGSIESIDSVDPWAESIQDSITNAPPPDVYFKKPGGLKVVLLELQAKNLAALLHSAEAEGPIMNMRVGLETSVQQYEVESQFILHKLNHLEAAITAEEDRAQMLKVIARKLLYGQFKGLIANKKCISLYVFVEDVYEACIASNDANMSVYEMMEEIEAEVEVLMLKLDRLPPRVVRRLEREAYRTEARLLREAKEAQAKLKLMAQLKKRMKRAMEPPFKIVGKQGKPRSKAPPPRRKPRKPATPLTEEQRDYLDFFTDYCPHTDNVKDYLPEELEDLSSEESEQ